MTEDLELIINDSRDLGYELELSTTELSHLPPVHMKADDLIPKLDLSSIDIAIVKSNQVGDVREFLAANGIIIIFTDKDISGEFKYARKEEKFSFLLCHEFEFGAGLKYEKFYALFLSDGIVSKEKIDDSDAISRDMTLINLVSSIGDEESTILLTDQRFLSFYYFMRITNRKIIMPIEDQDDYKYIIDKLETSNKTEDKNIYTPQPTLF